MSVYGSWLADAMSDALTGATVKAMLLDSTFVPNVDSTTAPASGEITGTGYTAGGVDVTSLVTVTYNSASNQARLSLSAPVNFGPIVATGIAAICFYISGGKPLAADVFGAMDWDGSSDFTYTAASGGVMAVQVA